jgi:serine/threonine-protein kinase
MGLATGNVLDRYVVESLIGSGAMGRVYRATDRRLRRAVALKVLESTAPGAETYAALREARAAAAIVHPNVTAVYDADSSGGTSFIVMELVPGTPLRALVGDTTTPLGTRMRWLVEIAAALSAAHHAGVIHRDVKPENVIVRDDGMVKVLDFGVARFAQAMTPAVGIAGLRGAPESATAMAGTPAYMAPEQINGEAIDGRADQFAWGVIGYELCAGRLPWRSAEGPFGVLAAILDEAPEPLPADVPHEVAAALLRALSKSPEDRFPSMGEAAAAIAPLVAGPLPSFGAAPDSSNGRPPSVPSVPDSHTRAREVTPLPAAPRVAPLAYSVHPPADEGSHDTAPPPSLRTLAVSLPEPSPAAPAPAAPTLAAPALAAPDFAAPVDLEAHVALLPSGASCKGMFFLDLLRAGRRQRSSAELHALAALPERRYLAFRDYPMEELLTLALATGRAVFPSVTAAQALRRLGQSAFEAVLESHLGRTILGVHGKSVDGLLLGLPRACQLLYSFGDVTVEKPAHRVYVLRAQRFPVFLGTYQVGVVEGALRHCQQPARVRVAIASPSEGVIEIDLQ